MTDKADEAADILEQHLAVSLANHQAKQPTTSRRDCEDCGEVIPQARLAIIKTTRCLDCQMIFESKARVLRGA